MISTHRAADGKKWAWRLDIAAPVRHDRFMERHALERLGHYLLSPESNADLWSVLGRWMRDTPWFRMVPDGVISPG